MKIKAILIILRFFQNHNYSWLLEIQGMQLVNRKKTLLATPYIGKPIIHNARPTKNKIHFGSICLNKRVARL